MKLKLFSSCTSTDNHQLDSFKRRYSIQSRLGKGTFGDVFRAQSKKSKTKVVVKVVKYVRTQEKVIYEEKIIPIEIWALRRLSGHPNIVRFVDNDLISDKHVIVTEFLRGYFDLFDYIEEHGKMSESRARNIIKQVVEGISFCFKMGIDHRDIKEENIMYNPAGENVKLINFGSASVLSSKPYTHIRGTDINLPPEHYLCNKYYPRPCAVWAIGCLTFCCLTSQTPFTSLNQILDTGPDWKLLAHCQDDTFDFVKTCLKVNEGQRIRFYLMKHHIWIADNIEDLSNLECSI